MNPAISRRWVLALAVTAAGCAKSPLGATPVPLPAGPLPPLAPALPAEESTPPALRLPGDVRPTAEALTLRIDPHAPRFEGEATLDVDLARPRRVLWLHGERLHVTEASATTPDGRTWPARWDDGSTGFASLTFEAALPAGHARLRIAYDAAFGHSLKGLYTTTEASEPYAFTQFEAIAARQAFPCFDEPSFKVPFDVTLLVPAGATAIANTREVARTAGGGEAAGFDRVHFAPTLPLPSYLIAFAVGPLEVVTAPDVPPNAARSRPLPLRGIAAKGRGKEIKDALAHTGEILGTLEGYFGVEYPYDKLDILAVPDKGGAMENAGAVTFKEYLLLWDEKTAPVNQRRAYAYVMAHELAHQWFGDLVTMNFWDDTWLNEAFATWMGSKAADAWRADSHAELSQLEGAEGAMNTDALASARAIRQPILSSHDIENAFDGITYRKGGAVLGMFERWLGTEAFQRGVRRYLAQHRFGSATADDFLDALAAGAAEGASSEGQAKARQVKAAFHTFLDQPGVPFIAATPACEGGKETVQLRASRFLPLGSTAAPDLHWQVPVCVGGGAPPAASTTCTLLVEAEKVLSLDTACRAGAPFLPFPNADAAGYYRFGLPAEALTQLTKSGLPDLTARERVALGGSIRAEVARGTLPMARALEAAEPFARDREPAVVATPMALLSEARAWLEDPPSRARVETRGAKLFAEPFAALGFTPRAGEDDDRAALRAQLAGFLSLEAREPHVRAEAKRRALAYLGAGDTPPFARLHPEAIDPNLAGTALAVLGEEASRATWDTMLQALQKSDDDAVRGRLLAGLGSALAPEVSAAARALTLNPALRVTEVLGPIASQLRTSSTREAAWAWLQANFDAVTQRVSEHHGAKQIVSLASVFCDAAHEAEVTRFFAPRVDTIDGGPRTLASTRESIHMCVERRAAQEPSARTYFGAAPGQPR